MCWSLRVSVLAGTISYVCAAYLWNRNLTVRDRWNSIFLLTFSSMQWIDAGIWALHDLFGESLGYPCSKAAESLNMAGMAIIMLEPIACLIGSMYARGKWWTTKEFLVYVVLHFAFQFFFGYITPYIYDMAIVCDSKAACPYLTENGHILLAFAVDEHDGPECWRQYGFFGKQQAEIPLWLRLAYLLGMIYPYIMYSNPSGSGLVQSAVLAITWMVGYFSDSHASMWCLANVVQVVTMYLDPYLFPPRAKGLSTPIKHRTFISRDLYNNKKTKKSYDFIVVGSGIGGLSSAALLAKAGYRVLVLEAHYNAGGCTHEFRIGEDSFDTGIHYIAGGTFIRSMLSFLTDSPGVALSKLGRKDDFCYDEFQLEPDGEIIKYKAGKKKVYEELVRHFPEEEDEIQKYFQEMKGGQNALGLLGIIQILPDWLLDNFPIIRKKLFSSLHEGTRRTAKEMVDSCVQNPKLRALLSAGQLIDWNLPPNKATWAVVGAMSSYYGDGGYYPVGGSKKIAETIIPAIERAGGRVLCRAKVEQFIFDEEPGDTFGTITGVRLANGDEIFARRAVISDMGICNTLRAVPEKRLEQAGLKRQVPEVSMSTGHMTAFICLDGPPEEFDLRESNIHSWLDLPKYDYDPSRMQEAFYKDPLSQSKGCLITLTAPSVKDPEYRLNHPKSANVLLLTEGKWEWFEQMDLQEVHEWYTTCSKGGDHGKRPKEYIEFKEKWKNLFLERLHLYYPKTKGHVTTIEIGTPITEAHFIHAAKGSSYGIAWEPKRFEEKVVRNYLRVKSKIPGLYITGESALFGGFAGAMLGGFIAAYKVLGFWTFLRVLLSCEVVDAEKEYYYKKHPELILEEAKSRNIILSSISWVIALMIGGRRLTKTMIKKSL